MNIMLSQQILLPAKASEWCSRHLGPTAPIAPWRTRGNELCLLTQRSFHQGAKAPPTDVSAPILLLHLFAYSARPCYCPGSLHDESSVWHSHLGLEEVVYAYTIKRHRAGEYYFVADAKPLQFVVNLPDTSKNMPQGNIMIFDAWSCSKDPMLRGFGIN